GRGVAPRLAVPEMFASKQIKPSAPAITDPSWLNPTTQAIPCDPSQPLSPVATQHSLPSGRYSLLGPDLHRLDRTSFAWRTHSITSLASASSLSGTWRPNAFAVLTLITVCNLVGCMPGKMAGLAALRIFPAYTPIWLNASERCVR